MTQGGKVGRGGDREAIRALDAVIFEKIEGVPWLAKHILAAIREGKVPGVSAVPSPSKCNIDDLCRICGEHHHPALSAGWHKETIAELRSKVASLEKDAADTCEALTITHGIGYNSRNDEVRRLQAERDEAVGVLRGVIESLDVIDQTMPKLAQGMVHGAFVGTEQKIRALLGKATT